MDNRWIVSTDGVTWGENNIGSYSTMEELCGVLEGEKTSKWVLQTLEDEFLEPDVEINANNEKVLTLYVGRTQVYKPYIRGNTLLDTLLEDYEGVAGSTVLHTGCVSRHDLEDLQGKVKEVTDKWLQERDLLLDYNEVVDVRVLDITIKE